MTSFRDPVNSQLSPSLCQLWSQFACVSGTLCRLRAQGKLTGGLDKQDADGSNNKVDDMDGCDGEVGDVEGSDSEEDDLAAGGTDRLQADGGQEVNHCEDEDKKVDAHTLFD